MVAGNGVIVYRMYKYNGKSDGYYIIYSNRNQCERMQQHRYRKSDSSSAAGNRCRAARNNLLRR